MNTREVLGVNPKKLSLKNVARKNSAIELIKKGSKFPWKSYPFLATLWLFNIAMV